MADEEEVVSDTLSLAAARRHDQLCDEFEARWRQDPPPRLEEALAVVPAQERAKLFAALLRIEIEVRPPGVATPGEYQARFPEFDGLIEAVFADSRVEKGVETGIETADGFAPLKGAFVPPALPNYEIIDVLGAGGMGIVYLARHLDLDRLVAVKVVKAGAWSRPEELRRFQLEARSVAGLNHPNVVQMYGFGQVEQIPYFVMEYVATGSLAARIKGKTMAPAWAAGLIETLARTVQYVHERGIVHRDLKPGNILLAADDTPKIADFGLAKRVNSDDLQLTASRAVLGSASYMAPEQAAGEAKHVGPAADIYALGAILFEMLTGRPPFRAETYELTIVQVLTDDPPRPTDLAPGLSPELEAICMKCLEKDAGRRYAAAGELADDLHRFREGLPVAALPLQVFDQDARWVKKIGCELIELLECTRWSVAYTARQSSINRKVVLKRSTGKPGSVQHQALRLQAEAMSGLSHHPNVVRLYDYGENFGQAYLVAEFIEGAVSLSTGLRGEAGSNDRDRKELGQGTPRRPFDPTRAAAVALRVALGVQAIHEQGFLHCALNSSDILLTADDVPKIDNFAAARRMAWPSGPGADWVFPNYLPPELLGEAGVATPATDVYGVGAVLYDLLVGLPPFWGSDPAHTRERALHIMPRRPSRFEPRVPPELDDICLRCLAKDPAARYGGAGPLALDLQKFLTDHEPSELSAIVMPEPGAANGRAQAAYQLRIESGPHDVGKTLRLPRQRVMIGRSAECRFLLRDEEKTVSRIHCGVIWNEETGRHELIDYGASNGVRVNGRRARGQVPLNVGDRITITKYVLALEVCTAPA